MLSRAVKPSRKPAGWICLQRYKQLTGVFVLFFVLGCGLSLIVSACSPSPSNSPVANSTSSPSHNLVLRIGHQKFDPLILVKAKGNLKLIPKSINVADAVWQSTTALGN